MLLGGQWLFRLDRPTSASSATSSASAAPPAGARSPCRTPGTSATTPTSRWPAASAGTARTSRCPSSAQRARVGRALRVGQLPLDGLAQRQADRAATPAPTSRSSCALDGAQAHGRQPARRPRRLAPPADRLPAVGPDTAPACRPAAGGTTAASSARSTCGSVDTVDFEQRPGAPDRCRCATCAARVRVDGRRCGTSTDGAETVTRHRHASAPSGSTSAPTTSAATAIATLHRHACGRASRSLWSPADPNLYAVSSPSASAATQVAGYTLHSGIRSIKVVRRAAAAQRPAA